MVVFLVAVAIFGALIVRNALDDTDQLPLAGRVIIQEPSSIAITGDTCTGKRDLASLVEGARIVITPTGQEPAEATLGLGAFTLDRTCEFPFSATVTQSTVYRFQVDGLPVLTRDHYLIDRQGNRGRLELAPILRWD